MNPHSPVRQGAIGRDHVQQRNRGTAERKYTNESARKRALFAEIFDRLRPGGTFVNLEHVASATPELHADFLGALGIDPADDDPSNILAPVADQLEWLRDVGFGQVDCHWKWRELALLCGTRP